MHRLLKRQIRKFISDDLLGHPETAAFLVSVNDAYINFQENHQHLERILEVSAKESFRELTNFKEAINAATMVAITDKKGRIQFVNQNFLDASGYEHMELMGKSHRIFNSGHHDSAFFRTLWETILNGKIWKGDIKNRKKDGSFFWADTTIVPLLNSAGMPNQFITIRKDITKEKQAEVEILEYAEHLEHVNKELDQFAYVVSHDLKAPLRAINNLSEWIEEDIGDKVDVETKKNLNLLRGRVHRMENLINGILEYSRVGRKEPRSNEVNVKELLSSMLSKEIVPENCNVKIPEELPIFDTEMVAFEQVFSNLISNSIKYNTSEHPEIEICFDSIGPYYKFSVKDNGPGIAAEFHEQIFTIFQTLQPRDKIESTGVGLAIVKKIINEKSGDVWVESELGEGATFHFTWPQQCNGSINKSYNFQ
jgi:PAS domain S-box-containing protein